MMKYQSTASSMNSELFWEKGKPLSSSVFIVSEVQTLLADACREV